MFMLPLIFYILVGIVYSQEIQEPFNLTAVNITGTSVTLIWTYDGENMEMFGGYQLTYQNSSFKGTTSVAKSSKSVVMKNLRPFTEYEFWITLVTVDNKTLRSTEKIKTKTDILPPSAPVIKSVTKISEDKILLEWSRPLLVYTSVDWYYVRFRYNKGFGTQQLFAKSGADQQFTLEDVRKDARYCFTVEAMAKGIFHQGFYDFKNIFRGPKSNEKCTGPPSENLILSTPLQSDTPKSTATSVYSKQYYMFFDILIFLILSLKVS